MQKALGNQIAEDRSLTSLKSDHENFVKAGNNTKNAKEFNNVIDEPMFNIPLEQVSKKVWNIFTAKRNYFL